MAQTAKGSGGVEIPGNIKKMCIWHLRAWLSGEHRGGAGLKVGFDDLSGFFQI